MNAIHTSLEGGGKAIRANKKGWEVCSGSRGANQRAAQTNANISDIGFHISAWGEKKYGLGFTGLEHQSLARTAVFKAHTFSCHPTWEESLKAPFNPK